jgi:hypothetical protein
MCQSLSLFFMARTVLIDAVPGLLQVWSLVRSFDQPQRYKPFVSRCVLRGGDLEIGSVREVNVKTGLPATTSTERLEQLDDDEHILSVKFVGGDHRLRVRTIASRFVLYLLTKPDAKTWSDILASGYNNFVSQIRTLVFI